MQFQAAGRSTVPAVLTGPGYGAGDRSRGGGRAGTAAR
jgi:hypothetical protein